MKKRTEIIAIVAFAVLYIALSGFVTYSLLGCNDERRRIERGYTSDKDYTPTFDSRGEYHNNRTGERQIQYQGSREQRKDLDDIDRYMRSHPDF